MSSYLLNVFNGLLMKETLTLGSVNLNSSFCQRHRVPIRILFLLQQIKDLCTLIYKQAKNSVNSFVATHRRSSWSNFRRVIRPVVSRLNVCRLLDQLGVLQHSNTQSVAVTLKGLWNDLGPDHLQEFLTVQLSLLLLGFLAMFCLLLP